MAKFKYMVIDLTATEGSKVIGYVPEPTKVEVVKIINKKYLDNWLISPTKYTNDYKYVRLLEVYLCDGSIHKILVDKVFISKRESTDRQKWAVYATKATLHIPFTGDINDFDDCVEYLTKFYNYELIKNARAL